MLALLNVNITQQSPFRVVEAFQLLAGDIALLEHMLPDSGFVKRLEFGVMPNVSVRSITEFREELMRLDASALSEEEIPRSVFHPWAGTMSARRLRQGLLESIDDALRSVMGAVPL